MTFKEFVQYLCDHVLEGWKESADINTKEVKKGDGKTYTGIYIHEEGKEVAPMVYVDGFYQGYKDGFSMEEIIDAFRDGYEEASRKAVSMEGGLKVYDLVKDNIILELVNYEKNKWRLEYCPHYMVEDLLVLFRWIASIDEHGMTSAIVTNMLLENWEVDIEQIKADAEKNMSRLFPPKAIEMEDMLGNFVLSHESNCQMYILTNKYEKNGASVVLYKGFLKKFCEEYPGNYYLLPSSIHEFIAVPSTYSDPAALAEMVVDVNNSDVIAENEVLSNNIYYYDADKDKFSMVRKG